MILHDFYEGKAFDAYEYFGAHPQDDGVVFRVYAPAAVRVALIGEFNGWSEEEMIQEQRSGVFCFFSCTAKPGDMYKYRIYQPGGYAVDHCDPYGFSMELRPASASIITDLGQYTFTDENWMKTRDKNYNRPMNIYEVHLGSWRSNPLNPNKWYSYSELAGQLIEYVIQNGYTHIELLPLAEHPADCSWGYQTSGFFSPTSRYGTAAQLKELIDRCHRAGIGVIIDFVLVHFVIDSYSLARFDGTALYEYPSADTGYSEWGSFNFNYYRGEARSLLQSAANYWLTEYHFDGIRMDAVSNVIYWLGNSSRGINEGALSFIREMNAGLKKLHPTAMLIAEDSTSYLKVTAPVEYGGLGFDYKWDLGWMNDTLDYFRLPPWERPMHYHKLTFSMHYFYNELYLLPFSHDEVVHGKATIMQKMWGDYEQKFPQCRALYLYMYTHPGKKLNFMGNELGQFREWDEKREQDWLLLDYPLHQAFHRFITDLNHLYLQAPALYDGEYNSSCFRWLEVDAAADSVYIYQRSSQNQSLIVALNLSDQPRTNFTVGIDENICLREILNSDSSIYGGNTSSASQKSKKANSIACKGKAFSFSIDLAPFSGKIFEIIT